jgi:hypothetical protein
MLSNKELQKFLKNILPKNTTKLEIRYYFFQGKPEKSHYRGFGQLKQHTG